MRDATKQPRSRLDVTFAQELVDIRRLTHSRVGYERHVPCPLKRYVGFWLTVKPSNTITLTVK